MRNNNKKGENRLYTPDEREIANADEHTPALYTCRTLFFYIASLHTHTQIAVDGFFSLLIFIIISFFAGSCI